MCGNLKISSNGRSSSKRATLISPESLPQTLKMFQIETIEPERVRTLDELNKDYAEQVLDYAGGNKSKAAELLGISQDEPLENTEGGIGFTPTVQELQKGSKGKCLAMTTGLNRVRTNVNFSDGELLFAYGRPRQRAARCRRQAFFLHFLPAVLICMCNCSSYSFYEAAGEGNAL